MSETLNILMIEDNSADELLITHELRRAGFDLSVKRVQTADEMQDALSCRAWDVVISDYQLPAFSAPNALEIARNSGQDLPFIIVSGTIGEETAVQIMRSGAHDYLMKDNLSRLPEALRREIREAQVRKEHKQDEELLRESETSYRGLFNSVAEAIYIQDRDNRLLDVNDGAVKMYGFPRQTFIGKTPEFLGAPGKNDLVAMRRAIRQAFDGKPQQFECWGVRRNKEIFPKDVRVYKGNYFGQDVVIALELDITQQKQAEQALQRQLKELTILQKAATAGINAQSVDALVELITHEVGNAFYPDNFGILFLDESQQGMQPHPSYRGITESLPPLVPLDTCVAGLVVKKGQPYRSGDVRGEPAYYKSTTGIRSELCVPIKTGTRTIGVINAESTQPNFFTSDDERLLMTIAGQLATAIEHLRLFDAERKRFREAENLREATAALSTTLEIHQVLEVILTSLKRVVPYDSATVFLVEGDRLRVTIARGIPRMEELFAQVFPITDPIFLKIQQTSRPLILADAHNDPRFNGWGGTAHVQGWMGIPLIVRDEVIGYITLDHHKESAYAPEDSILAQAFANQAAAAIQNARLFERIRVSLLELNQAYESTIEGWSLAMDLRDKETEGHTRRVTDLMLRLARAMGVSDEELIHIRRGALLHDIGKMGVPDHILRKPDKLTEEESEEMRSHPQYAYNMLSAIDYLRPALDIPYCHHERWDGNGYPRGLKGEEIPWVGRAFAIVDVWDALITDRHYRVAWSKADAYQYLLDKSGIDFDPEIVKIFARLLDEGQI